jgi:hypothetical protein
MNCAGKSAAAQIFQNGSARRSIARAAADHGDAAWRKQLIKAIG